MGRFRVTVWSEHADVFVVEAADADRAVELAHDGECAELRDGEAVVPGPTFWGDTTRVEVAEEQVRCIGR